MEQLIWPGVVMLIGGLWLYYKVTNDGRIADLKQSNADLVTNHASAIKMLREDHEKSEAQLRADLQARIESLTKERDEARQEVREVSGVVQSHSDVLARVAKLSGQMIEAQSIMAEYLDRHQEPEQPTGAMENLARRNRNREPRN